MSYDISLINRKTKKVEQLKNPFYIRGGTVPAELDSSGNLVQARSVDASINITYNYAGYFHDASDGDPRFAVKNEDGTTSYGIRGLYGKTPAESLGMIQDLIQRISDKYQDKNGNWISTKRVRTVYFTKEGNKISDPIQYILHNIPVTTQEETYEVSEGDTSDYWEPTAANVILALTSMAHMAIDCFGCDCVWDGD